VPLVSSFHDNSPVTGIDTCVRKPVVISCNLDRTVRLWNYQDHRCELVKSFSEEPHAVSLHPSGHHAVVGFTDKLRLINLLMDDMRVFKELPLKLCKEVCFSHGGHYFAASGASGVVVVYQFYSGEKVAELRGHSSKVKSIVWSEDDAQIVTSGQDGAVYLWDWEEGKRLGEFVQKAHVYHSTVVTDKAVYCVGTDMFLKEFDLPELQVVKDLDTQVLLSQIAITGNKAVIFGGTAAEGMPGIVRAYNVPVTADFVEFPCLGAPVTRMRLSSDDRVLVATDEMGTIALFDVRDTKQDRGHRSLGGAQREVMNWSDEVLITRSDLDERNNAMLELRNKVDELQLHNEYQLRLKDMSYSEKIKEVQERFMQEVEQEKSKYELLREEKGDMELEFEERLKQMDDRHQHALQDEENAYQERIMAEVEDFQELVQERNQQQERWEEQRQTLIDTHERYVQELTDDFELKLEEDKQLRAQLDEEKGEKSKEIEEMTRQLEDDIDTEIQNLRQRYDAQLNHERELTLRYKGENGIMKKKFAVLQKNIEDQKEDIKSRAEKEEELNQQIKALEGEIKAHKKEIKTRDETIGDKEKKIYDLKKKNQELEKFKFVLDYKIKELKRQIEPRETEIASMKSQIKEMDQELEQYHKSNAQLDALLGDMRGRIDNMQKTIVAQRKRIGDYQSTLRRFKGELHECVQHIQNPEKLRLGVQAIAEAHLQDLADQQEIDTNVKNEYHRHQDYLERTFETLQQKFAMDTAAHQEGNMEAMKSNMTLIKEINRQREANKQMKQELQARAATHQRRKMEDVRGPGPSKSGSQLQGEGMCLQRIEMNKHHIAQLRKLVEILEHKLNEQPSRPGSREVLPPVHHARPQLESR